MRPRVLVVDDQPPIARMLRLMLDSAGQFEVREVTRALDVVDASRIFRPDLIVLDVEMPGKNGAELARELMRDSTMPKSTIIFFSGLISPLESGIRQTPNGPMRFLSKTAGLKQIVLIIQEALSPKQSEALAAGVWQPPRIPVFVAR